MDPLTHAPLPPSGAACWIACAQWPTMERLYGGADTAAALEGRAAHAVLAEALQGRWMTPGTVGAVSADGEVAEVTDEMLDGAAVFLDDVVDTLGGLPSAISVGGQIEPDISKREAARLYAETRVPPVLHPECWGTPDVFIYPDTRRVVLWDYKFGHRRVEAVRNWQTLAYLASLVPASESWSAQVRIVQPRNYDPGSPVRVWDIPDTRLVWPLWEALRAAARAAMEKDRTATPGPDQCRDCAGRHACGPLREACMSLVDFVGSPASVEAQSSEMAGRELAALAAAHALIEARVSGLEAVLTAAYKRGERGIGWAVERGRGRRVWTASVEQVQGLGVLTGVDLLKPPAVITPGQAKTRGVPETFVDQMSEQRAGSEKLVPDTQTQARRAFFTE